MAKKKLFKKGNIVYSTAPDFNFSNEEDQQESQPASQQRLTVFSDKKHRAGKIVSIISGFEMKVAEIETIAKQLKNHCGSGGSVKENEIIIQGDHREKIMQWLLKNGFSKAKKI